MAQEEHSNSNGNSWRSKNRLVLIGFLAIAGYFLWTEHRAHVVQFLPYGLLLFVRFCTCFMAGMEVTADISPGRQWRRAKMTHESAYGLGLWS